MAGEWGCSRFEGVLSLAGCSLVAACASRPRAASSACRNQGMAHYVLVVHTMPMTNSVDGSGSASSPSGSAIAFFIVTWGCVPFQNLRACAGTSRIGTSTKAQRLSIDAKCPKIAQTCAALVAREVCDVLAGFSLPRTLELSRGHPLGWGAAEGSSPMKNSPYPEAGGERRRASGMRAPWAYVRLGTLGRATWHVRSLVRRGTPGVELGRRACGQ